MSGKDQGVAVDQLIDAAAQVMTRGKPSPALRASVRARIGRRHSGRGAPLWVPALASAAAIVVAVIAMRPPVTPAVPTLGGANTGAPAAPRPVASTPQAPPVARAAQSERSERPDRLERTERSERPKRLLVIEPLSVPLMAVDVSSGVMPIEIEPLQVEPLQPQ